MPEQNYIESINGRVSIRLDTLIRVRWYAVAGQMGAVLMIAFGFGFPIPWVICLMLIALSTALNLILLRRYKASYRLSGNSAFALLGFDVLQLGFLLFLTGGLQNPFAILLMAPVIVAATSLRHFHILMLGTLAVAMTTLLAFWRFPLPWNPAQPLEIPFLYNVGIWLAIVCTLVFTAIYAFRVAEEARKLADALSATELVLQREQHLSALDGLAAAAAHELGTPLATIALVSKEMLHTLPSENPMREDAELLRSQARRCRDILQKLTSLSSEGSPIIETQTLEALIEEEVAPLREFGIEIEVRTEGEISKLPTVNRNANIHYGIGNLLDNAVDFAKEKVVVDLLCIEDKVHVGISDDGSGFPLALLDKLGEPFVTARKTKKGTRNRGMGLGLFIAKTLLERSGAEISFSNNSDIDPLSNGAHVSVVWPLSKLTVTQSDARQGDGVVSVAV